MDTPTLIFGLMTLALVVVTWQAWRMGNEKRDVALLGACSGVLGVGTVLALAL